MKPKFTENQLEDYTIDLTNPCPECDKLTLYHKNYFSPSNSWVGEQDLTNTVCSNCGWSEWD